MKIKENQSPYIFSGNLYFLILAIVNLIISIVLINNSSSSASNLIIFAVSVLIPFLLPLFKKNYLVKLNLLTLVFIGISFYSYQTFLSPYFCNFFFLALITIKNPEKIIIKLVSALFVSIILFSLNGVSIFQITSGESTLILLSNTFLFVLLMTRKELKMQEYQNSIMILKNKIDQDALDHDLFISRLTHQIRTPLNTFLGGYHYLTFKDNSILKNDNNYLIILEAARNLSNTFEKLLTFTRLSRKKLSTNIHPVNIDNLILTCVQNFHHKISEHENNFNYSVENLPTFIKTDEVILNQILNILIENSLESTVNGKVNLRVKGIEQGRLEITISDTGVGIPKNAQNIFKPLIFNQTGNLNNKDSMSLSIAYELVRNLNGQIDFVSTQNVGTTFYLELPFTAFDSRVKEKIITPRSNKILVVDDNPMIAKLISMWIDAGTYDYIYKANGEEAFDYVKNNEVGMVFMDIQMPIMDGIESTTAIRSHFKNNFHPIIVGMSANDSEEDRQRVMASGMNLFIPKPLTKSKILEVLNIHYHNERSDRKTKHNSKIIENIYNSYENDSEVSKLIISQFINSAPILLEQSYNNLINKKYNDLYQTLHQLKGLSKSIFYDKLTNELEQKRENITIGNFKYIKTMVTNVVIDLKKFNETKEQDENKKTA